VNKFSKTVILLSVVSLFADISSELLYPVLPLYLKSIGMGAIYIGILEGIADFTSGLSKTFFGKWSDKLGIRMPFVWAGYMLSSFSKAFIGVFVNPWWVLFTRGADRLGKGIRTSSRDAILSMEATEETKGAVFGFHRALDTTGAFIGPILALIYLHYYPGEYQKLFMLSLIPAVFVALFLMQVKEKKTVGKTEDKNIFWTSLNYWRESNLEYKKVVSLILIFTLVNSSDMFLLLRAKEITGSDQDVIKFYIFYNFIYACFSYLMGSISDKIGRLKVFAAGLFFFSMTYTIMGTHSSIGGLYFAFFLYGLFAASTEGISKAWISSLCKKEDLGVALGFQNTTQSLCTMFASFIAGGIWVYWGSHYVFLMSGTISFFIAVTVLFIHHRKVI
jgi:MFS family permease